MSQNNEIRMIKDEQWLEKSEIFFNKFVLGIRKTFYAFVELKYAGKFTDYP